MRTSRTRTVLELERLEDRLAPSAVNMIHPAAAYSPPPVDSPGGPGPGPPAFPGGGNPVPVPLPGPQPPPVIGPLPGNTPTPLNGELNSFISLEGTLFANELNALSSLATSIPIAALDPVLTNLVDTFDAFGDLVINQAQPAEMAMLPMITGLDNVGIALLEFGLL